MVALLLVRSITDAPFAVRAVHEFLAYRRSGSGLEQDDEILAVCLKGDLDAGLPIWHLADHELGQTPVRVCATRGAVAGVGIRESFSLSGIWAVCWVDGPLLRTARNSAARREALLRMLVDAPFPLGSSAESGVVFPVFGADVECVEAEVRALKARYPRLIGSRWYRDDRMRGIVSVEPV